MKVICESCGTVFKAEVIKDMTSCPVCGAKFEADDENNENAIDKKSETISLKQELEEADKSMMHFDEIHFADNEMEGFIRIQCKNCLDLLYLDIEDAEIIKEHYIKLKNEVSVECEKCKYKHNHKYLTYCERISTVPPLPRCPLCNSMMLKKIKTSSKFMAVASLGAFALPYTSKTYECQDCGYRF